jgi:hypothetical protein
VGSEKRGLTHLLEIPSETFFYEIFGRELAFSRSGGLSSLVNLPEISDLDSIYFSLHSAGSRLGIVDGHASPSTGTSLIRDDGRVRLDEVHAEYRSGKTLLLTHLQNCHIGVARLARSIECELRDAGVVLRKGVGANLFLTPPHSRGFDPHYDGHDVLILQLAGEKVWKVYDQLSEIPAGIDGGRLTAEQLSASCEMFTLPAGSVLYLPRGRPHEAYTTSHNSLHLTMSIIPVSLLDIIAEEIKNAQRFYGRRVKKMEPVGVEISSDRIETIEQELDQKWLADLNAIPESAPWETLEGGAIRAIRLADHIIVKIVRSVCGGGIEVCMPGATVTLGEDGLEAVCLLLAGKTISAIDISLGGRSVESKSRFLKQLVDVGLATPVATSCA